MAPESLFSQSDHLDRLSNDSDPLEVLDATVDFELFRGWLVEDLGHSDGSKGGRPPYHPVSMSTGLIVRAQYNLSDAEMAFMIRGRLSWMRCFGFGLGGAMPATAAFRPASSGWKKVIQDGIQWLLAVRPACQNRKSLDGASVCADRRDAGGAFAPPGPPGRTISNQMRSDVQQA